VTAAVEVAGLVIFKQGIASSFRPRRYYTIPKETHEAVLEDISQLFDFFLIEFQRILFAENVVHTIAVCQYQTLLNGREGNVLTCFRLSPLPSLATG
jgi:hypothetical protein